MTSTPSTPAPPERNPHHHDLGQRRELHDPRGDRHAVWWQRYWEQVGNEDLLAARALIELPPRVRDFFANYVHRTQYRVWDNAGNPAGRRRDVTLDWAAAARDAENEPFSSTEARLARLALAIATDRPYRLAEAASMNSWQEPVWRVLVAWGTNGQHSIR